MRTTIRPAPVLVTAAALTLMACGPAHPAVMAKITFTVQTVAAQ